MNNKLLKYILVISFLFFFLGCEDDFDGFWSVNKGFGKIEGKCLSDKDCSLNSSCNVDENICINPCAAVDFCGEYGVCVVEDRKTPKCICDEGYTENEYYQCI